MSVEYCYFAQMLLNVPYLPTQETAAHFSRGTLKTLVDSHIVPTDVPALA